MTPPLYSRGVGIHVTTTASGPAALDALAAAVRALQGGDPLRPVAIVVPTNTAGVMARRALGRRGGFAAIDVLTPFRLAELLGAPSLHAEGRRPVSTPVVDLAVRRVVHANPGLYAGVQHHQSTIVALRDLYRELRQAGAGSITALARTERGSEPARVAAEVARLLRPGWYDEGDLLARAVERAAADLPARLRRIVVHVPQRLRPLEAELLAAIGEHGTVEVVLGLSGHPSADADIVALASTLAGGPFTAPPTPDAGAALARRRVDHGRRRRGPRRRARHRRRRPPRHAVRPHRGAVPRRTTLRPARRAPPRGGGRPVERPSGHARRRADGAARPRRRARPRPPRAAPQQPGDPARRRPGPGGRRCRRADRAVGARRARGRRRPGVRLASHLERFAADARASDRWDADADADAAGELLAFVEHVAGRAGRPARHTLLGGVGRVVPALPRAAGSARGVSTGSKAPRARRGNRRRGCSIASPTSTRSGRPSTRAEFRTTFAAELDVTPGRHGRIGDGVHVSALAGAAGLDVDLAIVLGAAEGLLPPGPSSDPLLGDHERRLAGLAPSDELTGLVHRQFLAAVTTTPAALVTVPRGDLRATATRHPSRWLTPLLEGATTRVVDSHAQGLAATAFPASASEHRLRTLWTHVRAGADVRTLDAAQGDDVLRRALALRDARASDRFTEYDGNVGGRDVGPLPARVSATRIEAWPACPHAYFLRYVLGVQPIEEPESIETLSALDRGSALHAAIDRLHGDVLSGRLDAPGPDGWTRRAPGRPAAGGRRRRRPPRGARPHRTRGVLGQRPQGAAGRARRVAAVRRRAPARRRGCWRPSCGSATTCPCR